MIIVFFYPLIIESPYQEFNKAVKGGISFGGSDLTMNYQYSYYSNSEDQIMGRESWITERGLASDIKFSKETDEYGFEVPTIEGNWKHVDDPYLTATFKIKPVIHGKNAGKIYYKLKGKNWRIYGYKQKTKSEFEKISKDMCKLSNIKFLPVEQRKDICECYDVAVQINDEKIEDSEILKNKLKGCFWIDWDEISQDEISECNNIEVSKSLELALIDLGYDELPANGKFDKNLASNIQELNIYDQNINDLSGIEHFTNLSILDISGNKINTFDITLLPNLNQLSCEGNLFDCSSVQKDLNQRLEKNTTNNVTGNDCQFVFESSTGLNKSVIEIKGDKLFLTQYYDNEFYNSNELIYRNRKIYLTDKINSHEDVIIKNNYLCIYDYENDAYSCTPFIESLSTAKLSDFFDDFKSPIEYMFWDDDQKVIQF